MKKLTLLFMFLVAGVSTALAQNNYDLVFFTEEAEPFTVYINGVQQHAAPQTNVRVSGFIQPVLKLKVEFVNPDWRPVTKNLYMPETSSEVTYRVKKTKKGFRVRVYSMVSLAERPPVREIAGQQTVVYSPVPVVTQTTTTTTTTTGGADENINVDMNVGGVGMDVNVSVNLGGNDVTYEETTTTTTTTTTDHYIMQGYDGDIGCPWPMTDEDFEQAKATILSKSFDDTRLSMAKQIIRSNCMFSDQIRDLVGSMEFEDTKLDLAKFAYGYAYDVGNYFKVNDVFDFEFSIEELNEYIDNYRR